MESRRKRLGDRRGQSLVEFALVLPVMLLIVMFALDFGRVFYSWVSLNNAARIGADYAATHPFAWDGVASPSDATQQAEYVARVQRELASVPCDHPIPAPPLFPGNSLALGQPTRVALTCSFKLLTPLIGTVLGSPLKVGASSVFPIRSGLEDREVPLPPCFNQAVVPFVVGLTPNQALVEIQSVGLIANGQSDSTWKGKPNDVKTQNPSGGSCVDFNTTVTYVYKP